MAGRLAGRVIIVTGGGSGIGRAAAMRLAADGASVCVADLREALAQEVADAIEAAGGRAIGLRCDVSREDDVEAMVHATVTRFGGLTGLYANAGTAGSGWIHDTRLEDWQRVIDINLTGAFLCAKHALPHLMKEGGVVVTTGSVASVIIGGGGSAASYAASKGGLLQLTKQIAVDYSEHRIRAVCVCPGLVRTQLAVHAREDRREEAVKLPRSRFDSPANRAADPQEVGSVVAFLFSDDASFITGSAVFVDGGMTAI